MFKGIDLLAKVVATRFRLSKAARAELTDEMQSALGELDDLWPQDVPHA